MPPQETIQFLGGGFRRSPPERIATRTASGWLGLVPRPYLPCADAPLLAYRLTWGARARRKPRPPPRSPGLIPSRSAERQ